jgi:hypothetical protein
MIATIELDESIYSAAQVYAEKYGLTLDAVLEEALVEKLDTEREPRQRGWRSVFGKGDKEAVAEVQRIIDKEFAIVAWPAR